MSADKRQQIHTDPFYSFSRIESMTTVIGIKCKEGIILASDSQGTSDDEKTKVKKIFNMANTSIGIGFSGYDDSTRDFIRYSTITNQLTSEKILREELYNAVLEFKKYTLSHNVAEHSIKTICVYSPIRLGMLVGAIIDTNYYLYQIRSEDSPESLMVNLIDEEYGYIGSGKNLARLVLSQQKRFNDFGKLDINTTIGLALYVLDEIKQIDPKTGNDTQISIIDKSGYREIPIQDHVKYYQQYIQYLDKLLYEHSSHVNNRKEFLTKIFPVRTTTFL